MEDKGIKICSRVEMLDSTFSSRLGVLSIIGRATEPIIESGISVGDIVVVRAKNFSVSPDGFAPVETRKLEGLSKNISRLKIEGADSSLFLTVQEGEIIKHYVSTDEFLTLTSLKDLMYPDA